MKKKSLLLTAVATLGLITATTAQNVPSYVPTNGLVGWWPFNGNANDESGNGNNGTVNGATLTTDRFGNANKAYSFDGVSDFIGANILTPFTSNITISVWYNTQSIAGGPFVHIGQDNGGNPYCDGFDIGKGGTTLNNPGNDLISGFSCIGYYDSDVSGVNNQWNHAVLIKSANQIQFYLNGIFIYNINTVNVVTPSQFLFFASTSYGFSTFYNGSLDDIAIYNRALTQQEITDLYNGCQLTVNTQPNSQTININNNAQFIVGSSDSSATFQWQTDLGVGFQNLNSVGQYNGTTNDTLNIANVTMGNHNQPFRCIISSGSCSDTSNVAVLTVNNNIGLNQFSQENLISIYPNPAQTVINVNADLKLVGESYTLIDNTGRIVLSGRITNEITTIELDNLSNGVYMFTVGNHMKQQFIISKQ